jgi:hypothetical protein
MFAPPMQASNAECGQLVEVFNEINESWDAMMVKAATTVNVIEVPCQSVGSSRAFPKRTYVRFAKVNSLSLQGEWTLGESLPTLWRSSPKEI